MVHARVRVTAQARSLPNLAARMASSGMHAASVHACGQHRQPSAPYPPGAVQVEVLSDATASATPAVQQANLHDLRQVGVATPSLEAWASSVIAQVAAHAAI